MVRLAGLEPVRLSTPDPKSGASTNFATGAISGRGGFCHIGRHSSRLNKWYEFCF